MEVEETKFKEISYNEYTEHSELIIILRHLFAENDAGMELFYFTLKKCQ